MSKALACLVLAVITFLFANAALGDSAAAPASQPAGEVRVKGKITVTGSNMDRVTAATLTADDGTVYSLEIDAAGEDLARVMFGQKVDILGIPADREGKKGLRVTGFAEDKFNEAHELWRRSRCNACAVQRGEVYAAEPKDLHGATAVTGRLLPYKQLFRSITRDDKFLWLATDALIYQVDLANKKLVKTYDQTAGLPDQPLLEIGCPGDGKTLWILSRGSGAALTIGQDKAVALPAVHCAFAKLLVDYSGAWVIADNGTYRYTSPDQPPKTFPALPTGKRMAAEINKGMWLAFWKQNTAFYMQDPVAIGDKLYVGSFGDVYELADGAWAKAIPGAAGSQQQARKGRLWVFTSAGLVEYDPATKASKTHKCEEIADGRLTGLLVTDTDAWVTAEPIEAPKAGESGGGGVGRMDLATGKWQSWKQIDGMDAAHAVVQAGQDGAVWVITHQGKYQTLAAHPGMTYVQKTLFDATDFGLHRWDAAASKWQTMPLASTTVGKRYVCGQDGQGSDDEIAPQNLDSLCIGADRIFAVTRLVPVGVFSGYWPCVDQVATRLPGPDGAGPSNGSDGKWTAKFEHHPEQLDLQGEQPLVLNISNKGEMILPAVGHDNVLDLFLALPGKEPWAVTEGCVGWFDSAKGAWQKVVELGFNVYWRPTAILDEGDQVFIGSDRGLVSRLDLKTGRCQIIGGLKNRMIERFSPLGPGEGFEAVGGTGPLGQLPSVMGGSADMPTILDSHGALWTGKRFTATRGIQLPPPHPASEWQFKPVGELPKTPAPFMREQVIGNMLWGPADDGKIVPRYYVKEVYAPRLLDFGQDGKRMWLSTFAGLVRVDLPVQEKRR